MSINHLKSLLKPKLSNMQTPNRVLLYRQIITFVLVGILNTLVGYSLYAFFIFMHLPYQLAVLFATIIGVLFNFKSIGKLVFRHNGNQFFLKFLSVYTFLYFLNIELIRLIQLYVNNLYVDGFLAVIPLAIISFILNKCFVFRNVYEIN